MIQDGLVAFMGDKLTYVGERSDYIGGGETETIESGWITPGFVNIHCHDAAQTDGSQEPEAVATHFLHHGSTSMLLTLYSDVWLRDGDG